jgi:hypothetical protein
VQNGTGDTTTGTIDQEGSFSTSRIGASYTGFFDPVTCTGEAVHLYDTFEECVAQYGVVFAPTD